MAREGRNVLAAVFKNFIDSLKPRRFRGNLIGKDYLGNEYFEIPQSSGQRASRWFVPKGGDESKFDEQLPAEWEAWLRNRRKKPPTEAEIAQNVALMDTKKNNASEIDLKFATGKDEPGPGKPISFPELQGFEQYPGKKPREN